MGNNDLIFKVRGKRNRDEDFDDAEMCDETSSRDSGNSSSINSNNSNSLSLLTLASLSHSGENGNSNNNDINSIIPCFSQKDMAVVHKLYEKNIENMKREMEEITNRAAQANAALYRALDDCTKEKDKIINENKVLKQGINTLHAKHVETTRELEATQKALREEREKTRQMEIIFRARMSMNAGQCRLNDNFGGGNNDNNNNGIF